MQHDLRAEKDLRGRVVAKILTTPISLTRVTSILLAGRLVGFTLLLVNSIILARCLGVEDLGRYAYAMGIPAMLGLLPNLGISTVITRAIAQDPDASGGIFRCGLRAQVLLAIAVFGIVLLVAIGLPRQPVPLLYVGLAATQLSMGALSWPYLAVLGGRGRYDLLAVSELIVGVSGTLTLLAAAGLQGTIDSFLWAQLPLSVVAILVARHLATPFMPSEHGIRCGIGTLLRQAFPFGAAALVQGMYMRVDLILLGQMTSPSVVGLYSAAYKPINMVLNFGASAAGTLFPFLVQEARTGPSGTFDRVMRVFAVAAPALAIALSGLSGMLLQTLYGREFESATLMLIVLAWSAAANWLYAPMAIALQARGKEQWWVEALCAALGLNILLNMWTIPRWGGVGAAASTLACEVMLLVVGGIMMQRSLGMGLSARMILALLGTGGLGAVTLYMLWPAGGLVATLAATGVYAAALWMTGVATSGDVAKFLGRFRDGALGQARA
ncbi:MAG: flippase [Nitrospiraceae bacterium]